MDLSYLEKALIAQAKRTEHLWVLNNKVVSIEELTEENLKEVLDTHGPGWEDPDGSNWAGSGKFSSKAEAYAHCAAAVGLLRIAPKQEVLMLESITTAMEDILDLGAELAKLKAEVNNLTKR